MTSKSRLSGNPQVDELFKRQRASKKAKGEISRRLLDLIEKLEKKYPGQTEVIRRQLEGQAQRLLRERDEQKREALIASRSEGKNNGVTKRNGTNGSAVPGGIREVPEE